MQIGNHYKKDFGKQGEDLAVSFLSKMGFKIKERNFLIRGGEIDIVARDLDELVFIEVKSRINHQYGLPEESITYFKAQALKKTALFYIQKINWGNRPYRFDLVTIEKVANSAPKIDYFKNIL